MSTEPDPDRSSPAGHTSRWWHRADASAFALVAGSALAAWWAWRWWLLPVRYFDPDEFAHLHTAWCIGEGLLPYRDFFEHHTPLLHYLLVPIVKWYAPAQSVEAAVACLWFSRCLMWVFTAGLLGATWWLGQQRRSVSAGGPAALCLVATPMFLAKTLEVRPDGLAVLLLLVGLGLLVTAVRHRPGAGPRWTAGLFLVSGVSFSLAILATQKTLFVLPGVVAAALWYLAAPCSPLGLRERLRYVAWLGVGGVAPALLALGWFSAHGAGGQYVELNFILNSQWKLRLPVSTFSVPLIHQNPWLVALGLTGLAHALLRAVTSDGNRAGAYVLPLAAVSLLAGLFIIPVPHRQYYLFFLPLLAVFEASLLVDVLRLLGRVLTWRHPGPAGAELVLLAGVAGSALWCLGRAFGVQYLVHPRDALLFGAAALLVFVLVGLRMRHVAMLVVLVLLGRGGYQSMVKVFEDRNDAQLADLRYVMESTRPDQAVMDGWTGLGVFRPHASYYFFLHPEILVMLSPTVRDRIVADLETGSGPEMIIFDENLASLSPRFTQYVRRHYRWDQYLFWRRQHP